MLTLDSEVAQSIARTVEVKVTGEEHARGWSPRVRSRLKSTKVISKPKNNSTRAAARLSSGQSIAYFEETIGKDANFAPAYVGLARAYERLGSVPVGGSPKETHPGMMSAARKAIELDPRRPRHRTSCSRRYIRNSGSGAMPKRNSSGRWS